MLKNEILLPGVHNSRELGGYLAGGRIVKKGVLIRTGELVSSYYQTVDSIYDYPINHPLIKEEDVLFVDKSKDYYTNIDIVNKNKVSFFEVQEEYYRLLADGLSEKEIHSKMIEEYKTPKKGKTYEK